MSTFIASRLKLRLFVEGVEIPIIAANIQASPNSPVAASLQIPPLEEATRWPPGMLVHLFFFDYAEAFSGLTSLHSVTRANRIYNDPTTYEKQKSRAQNPEDEGEITPEQLAKDQRNDRFKLVFCGETTGFQFTKNVANRSIVLQCLDLSSYWDRAYQFGGGDIFGPGVKALFSGGGSSLFSDFLESNGGAIINIIQTPSQSYPGLKGVAGGLIHLVEAIGGYYYGGTDPKKRDSFCGVNPFFSIAELRLHMSQMVHCYNGDDSSQRILGGSYDDLFGRTLNGLGEQVSIRQAINSIGGAIYYETYSQPSPLYVPGSSYKVSGSLRYTLEDSPFAAHGTFATEVRNLNNGITEGMAALKAVSEEEADASFIKGDIGESLLVFVDFQYQTVQTLIRRARQENYQYILPHLTKASSALTRAKTTISQFRARFTKVANIKVDDILKHFGDVQEGYIRALNEQIYVTSPEMATPAKLISHIFRPDTWFTSPPRCNVIFPDQYTQITYSRNYLAEPTRLLLKTHDEFFGEDELFDNFYFAPKAMTPEGERAELQKLLEHGIMDHEIYTGILPVFEKLGEFSIFGIRTGKGKAAKGDKKKFDSKVGFAQRSANFLYYRYRFSARQLQVSALFMPYLACGFPSFVINGQRPFAVINNFWEQYKLINQTTKTMAESLGSHFLGNLTNLQHSLSQMQGQTSLEFGYVRQTDESTEFLGGIRPEDQEIQKKTGDVLREDDYASLVAPKIGDFGPNNGIIALVQDVTDQYGGNIVTTARRIRIKNDVEEWKLPVYLGPRRKGTQEPPDKVTVGVPVDPTQYSKAFQDSFGQFAVTFRAYRIREEVPQYRREKVELPVEELVRPGWYGDCWMTQNVGKVYQALFRTDAITDPTQVVDAAGAPQRGEDQDAVDKMADAATETDRGDDPLRLVPAVLALDEDATIAQACAFILLTYSYVKAQNLDIKAFIDTYNWRPIASIVDMFGTSDLEFDEEGKQANQGIEGFHSRAFGLYENLFGLLTPNIKTILGYKEGEQGAKKMDVRKIRREAVLKYVTTLTGRGVLG